MNEDKLIELIIDRLGSVVTNADISVGPGDDAAIVRIPDDEELVVTTDVFLAERHFPRHSPGDLVGYRCVAAALSDVIAMAGKPRFITVAISIDHADEPWLLQFADGVRSCCLEYGIRIVGGNLTNGPKSIAITALGSLHRDHFLCRTTVQLHDEIWITGRLGATEVALRQLATWQSKPLDQLIEARNHDVVARYFLPKLPVEFSSQLHRFAHALTDISDGLHVELQHLVAGTNFGARIDVAAIPLWLDADPAQALGTDDSYELLFTVPTEHHHAIRATAKSTGTCVSCIGAITATPGVKFFLGVEQFLPNEGYSHF